MKPLKRQFYYTIALLLSTLVIAQNPEQYQEIYVKTYLETSQTDFEKALEVADSLYQISKTDLFKTKSLMLTASLYQKTGDLGNGIKYARMAENYSLKTNDLIWKTRVLGFLATQYRILNLNNQSRKYAKQAYSYAREIKDLELGNSTLGLMKHEMAFDSYHREEFDETLQHLKEAHLYFQKTKSDKEFLLSNIEQFLGKCFLALNQLDSAMFYLDKSLETYGELPDTHVNGLAYKSKGELYLKLGELNLAEEYFNKALNISDKVNHLEFKKVTYQSFMDLNSEKRNMDQYLFYKNKRDSINQMISSYKSTFVDDSITDLTQQNEYVYTKISSRNYMIFTVFLLIIVLMVWFIWYRKKQKENINKFKAIIAKLHEQEENYSKVNDEIEENKSDVKVIQTEAKDETVDENRTNPYMLDETEQRILAKLDKFEKETKFTKKSVSLTYLALYCDTNTKYLSQVINTHKNKDFNNYINELRVNYIIKKLKDEPIYRKYKIATLADEAGFSSQNKLSTVFKKVTSISPSVFIKYLEDEE